MTGREAFHLLVVDDNAPFRQSLNRLLTGMGYTVFTAANGFEALELLKSEEIHLVFADVKMPGMTGVELLKQIKHDHQRVNVILMTVSSELIRDADALDLQASGYLIKPIKRHEITEVLQRFDHRRI